jgi:hypothetical protein
MNWFERLTGIEERNPEYVRSKLDLEGETLVSRANSQRWQVGCLETPSLGELRERITKLELPTGRLQVGEIVADARELHADPENANALFQVASQFNLLEMIGPEKTPEHGIGIYERDPTQGPVCAIAAGAGTICRNYLVPVNGRAGQSAENQIDCLADLGEALGNQDQRLWTMRNGYALATESGLADIAGQLERASESERDELRARLRIGLQWNTQVTLPGCDHTVSQAYCSALPVAYSHLPTNLWEPFARLVLEAAYEAVILAGLLNHQATGDPRVHLTLIGGGAFRNLSEWIIDALQRAVGRHEDNELNVQIVSYGRPQPAIAALVDRARWR